MRTTRVLIADDMTLVRQGMQCLLERDEGLQIVGSASDAYQAQAMLTSGSADVVLLDQDMLGLGTAETIVLLKEQSPEVEIIVLAEPADEEKAFLALEAGASGYLVKDVSAEKLIQAIEQVRNGRSIMHPYITRQLVERFRVLMRERSRETNGHLGGLTRRETEILLEMARGATDREIARIVHLGESTVKSHIRSILRKMGARNRTQAVAHVLKRGMVA